MSSVDFGGFIDSNAQVLLIGSYTRKMLTDTFIRISRFLHNSVWRPYRALDYRQKRWPNRVCNSGLPRIVECQSACPSLSAAAKIY